MPCLFVCTEHGNRKKDPFYQTKKHSCKRSLCWMLIKWSNLQINWTDKRCWPCEEVVAIAGHIIKLWTSLRKQQLEIFQTWLFPMWHLQNTIVVSSTQVALIFTEAFDSPKVKYKALCRTPCNPPHFLSNCCLFELLFLVFLTSQQIRGQNCTCNPNLVQEVLAIFKMAAGGEGPRTSCKILHESSILSRDTWFSSSLHFFRDQIWNPSGSHIWSWKKFSEDENQLRVTWQHTPRVIHYKYHEEPGEEVDAIPSANKTDFRSISLIVAAPNITTIKRKEKCLPLLHPLSTESLSRWRVSSQVGDFYSYNLSLYSSQAKTLNLEKFAIRNNQEIESLWNEAEHQSSVVQNPILLIQS